MTTTIIFALIFFVMIGYYVYFLVVESHDVVNNDYNKRIDGYAETVVRGTIFSADGDKLAYTKTDDAGNETREYPYDELFSHVIGIKKSWKIRFRESLQLRAFKYKCQSYSKNSRRFYECKRKRK